VILAFVIGFAATQYLAYLNYKRTNERALAGHAEASAAASIPSVHSSGPGSNPGKGDVSSMPSTVPAGHSP
jgi:hypothetical protein